MAEKKQAPLNTLLTIYFYHTRLTRESYEEWKEYKFPGHILYGLPLLENYGIRSVMHKCKYFSGRLKLMFYATKEILCCKEKYDVLYATSFRGIEPVIFLRALGLYRKPIVIWRHTAVVTNPKPWREQISRLLGPGPSFLRPSAGRNARPEARRIYLHRQREPGRGHPAPVFLRNQ